MHKEDYSLVITGILNLEDLITIRKGEYVHHPLSDKPQPTEHEIIKIRGKGTGWCCIFLDEKKSLCSLYEHRPLACRLLKCWAPEDVLAISGKNLLNRFAFISEKAPFTSLIHEHEAKCPVTVMNSLAAQWDKREIQNNTIAEISRLVNLDCQIRSTAVRFYRLSLAEELFFFGRPMFQLLLPLGITFTAAPDGITLQCTTV